jgi:hypothetical protein
MRRLRGEENMSDPKPGHTYTHLQSDWPAWQRFLQVSPRLREMSDQEIDAAYAEATRGMTFVSHEEMTAKLDEWKRTGVRPT